MAPGIGIDYWRSKINRLTIDMAGRPVQTMLRRFPWPIKKTILRAPALQRATGTCRLLVMTTPRDWFDALWSAYSWQFFTDGFLKPTLAVDGAVTASMQCQVEQIMPGAKIVPASAYLAAAEALLPDASSFFRNFKYGRKLAVVLVASNEEPVLYSDSDVLVFRKPNEILSHISANNDTPLYNNGDGGDEWNAPLIIDLMRKVGLSPLAGFNSGLMFIPQKSLDLKLCSKCMSMHPPGREHFFTEQSIFNALLASAKAQALDSKQYSISEKGMYFYESDMDYQNIVTRHFTGVVRHRMYMAGMPLLARKFLN